MPHATQQENLLLLQTAAMIKDYRNIDAGSVYELSKSLKSIAASYSQFESISLLMPAAKGQNKSNMQTLLEENNIQKIVGDETRLKIVELADFIRQSMKAIWRDQSIDTFGGVDLGLSEAKLQEETKKILVALYQDQGARGTPQLIKRISEVLQGSVKLKPEQVLSKHLKLPENSELVSKITVKFHLINDGMMKSIGEQNASFTKIRKLLNTEKDLESELEKLEAALQENKGTTSPSTPSSPDSTPGKNPELTALTKVTAFLAEIKSGTSTGSANSLTDLVAVLPKNSQSLKVNTAVQKINKLVKSGYNDSHQQLFKGCKIEESVFLKTLKTDLDITDQDQVDLEMLCSSLIEVEKESKKQYPNKEQFDRLLDLKAGLQARKSEAEIAKMRKDSEEVLTDVTKAWEENMGKLDQANDGSSGLNADKEKLRLQDNTIDALQGMLFALSQGTELTASVHKNLLACQKQAKHMRMHQTAVNTQNKKPTWIGRIRPIFSSHYAFSAITLYSILACVTLAVSWYATPVLQGVLQPLAVAFGFCAGEKLLSQLHTAYTRQKIAFERNDKPGFLESFWTMPASGRSNGLLSLIWVGLPHVMMGLAAISGAGIYARLAALGRFFLTAEKRLQVTAVGLSTVCAGKVLTNHAATPPSVSSLKDVEAEIICAQSIQKHFVYRAWETVARDFAVKNKSVVNNLVKEEYNDEMKQALTAFSNYNKDNKSVPVSTLIHFLQTIKSATIIESKPKRNILVSRANNLEAEVTKIAVKLAKDDYLAKQQTSLTDKHYGFVSNTMTVDQDPQVAVKKT